MSCERFRSCMPLPLPNPIMLILLALICIALVGNSNALSMDREMEMERKLQLLNRPAVKSIQSKEGDIVDCVDIYKQPAFDHPRLKNHTIQMRPHRNPSISAGTEETTSPSQSVELLVSSQVWRKSGSCPEGTVPIRRVQKHHLANAPSLQDYGKKNLKDIKKREFRVLNQSMELGVGSLHSSAVLATEGRSYIGAKADINAWNPSLEADDEYSSAQIWLTSGPYGNSDSIEYGWMVNPAVYGDRRTRLFIYWTTDSGKTTGCFDLLCSGFVQTSHEIALGAALEPLSAFGGQQYHITLYVWKDADAGKWWLVFGKNTTLGYWPVTLFKDLYRIATVVLFGGDVYSPRLRNKPHTATQMGSGRYASDHWKHACFIQQPRIMDYSLTLKYPQHYFALSMETDCYSAENWADVQFTEPTFYFGGPGRSRYCP